MPLPTFIRGSWERDALCQVIPLADIDVFHPQMRERTKARAERVGKALAICAECPARKPCAEWALEQSWTKYTVVGGLVITGTNGTRVETPQTEPSPAT